MKELNDIDFDKAFKTRITEELPEFEEESWLKMEKKLRKRERLIYYRYASILLVLLSFGIGFYLLSKNNVNKVDTLVSKKAAKEGNKATDTNVKPTIKDEDLKAPINNEQLNSNLYQAPTSRDKDIRIEPSNNTSVKDEKSKMTESVAVQNSSNNKPIKTPDIVTAVPKQDNQIIQNVIANSTIDPAKIDTPINKPKTKLTIIGRKKIPISVAVVSGPDFSSTSAFIGGKTGVSFGAMVSVGLTKKLSVQTGIAFGSKNYYASAYDYTFNNPNVNKANYAEIDAACKVVEIPLRASYNISENHKRSIELNAGVSSYLMVSEKYIFKYTPAANRTDRITDIANKNQHYLSVIDLSATYNLKLKNKKFAVGIEPYVKIPLKGIGEGNVPLKSSGVSLKLRYDFNKN